MAGPSLAWQGGGPKEEGEVIYGLGLRFGASGNAGWSPEESPRTPSWVVLECARAVYVVGGRGSSCRGRMGARAGGTTEQHRFLHGPGNGCGWTHVCV